MLGIMFQKLWSKKWMLICLILGSVLLTATMVSFPLYQSAVFDKMLQSEFRNYLSETGLWPARLDMETLANIGDDKEKVVRIEKKMSELETLLGVTATNDIHLYYLLNRLQLASGRRDIKISDLRPGILTGLPDHVTMLSGQMYSDEGVTEDGCIEVVISESCMNKTNLLLDDVLQVQFSDNYTVSFKITGVFRANEDRYYWEPSLKQLENVCLMQEEQFRKTFLTEDFEYYCTGDFFHYFLFDYETLRASQVPHLLSAIAESKYEGDTCTALLEIFQEKSL